MCSDQLFSAGKEFSIYIMIHLPSWFSIFWENVLYPSSENSGVVTRHFGFLDFTSFIAIMLGFKSLILNSN